MCSASLPHCTAQRATFAAHGRWHGKPGMHRQVRRAPAGRWHGKPAMHRQVRHGRSGTVDQAWRVRHGKSGTAGHA